MHRYKTILTDYEALPGILDSHAAQGWRLASLTVDTWRRTVVTQSGEPLEELASDGKPQHEYSASYYLVVLSREGEWESDDREAALEEPLSKSSRPYFE